MQPVTAVIALGSNLGDRAAHIRSALHALSLLPATELVACATPIENPALAAPGIDPGGDYLNTVALLRTQLEPLALLQHLHAIEHAHGRDRSRETRWGPRTLDLDIVVFGDRSIDLPGLRVPHPRMHERRFVLEPLHEIAPDLIVPGHGSVRTLLVALNTRKD